MTFDFRNPDYVPVFIERAERLQRLSAMKPDEIDKIKAFYRDHPVEFINDWVVTSDPRNVEIGLPVNVPFLLFPKQAEFVEWVYDLWRNREDGLAEKSRDMGVSWLCCAVAVHMWLFYKDAIIGFGSRKEEYVDEIGNLKALFPKIRAIIDMLPPAFRPKGWSGGKFMLINNPENGASIIGEAGDNIGRGARTGIYFKDESAFYERSEKIEAALSQTSNCKIDVSTPNGSGNSFYRKRHKPGTRVFTFHWTDDPRKDQMWYEKQKRDLDAVIVAQEVDIDYSASVTNVWLSGDLIESAFNVPPTEVEAVGPMVLGVDAARYGDDKSVVTARRGRRVLGRWRNAQLESNDLAGWVSEIARPLNPDAIVWELDGPGVGAHDIMKRSEEFKDVVVGVHTGAKLSDGKNYNIRARAWRKMGEWYADTPASAPRDGEFKAQASAMRYSYRDGLLLMEDKKEYKKRVGRSPDDADSEMLTHAIEAMPRAKRPTAAPIPSTVSAFRR